jgi:hypothetical protein
MSCIDQSTLQRHSEAVLPAVEGVVQNNYASLSVRVQQCTILKLPMFFHFKIDNSGSMGDECKDGRTKMRHIIHTLSNMIRFFANSEASIFIEVCTFDDEIEEIVTPRQVTKDNFKEIIAKLGIILPRNSTNIEKAIIDSNNRINSYVEKNPTHRVSQVFMTDGDATCGSKSMNHLESLVDKSFPNSFIAFGINHNAELMTKLGRASEKSSNWLIEKLENAGLVYGEILNNEMYIGAEDVTITMSGGKIYNYTTNEFVETLNINTLVTETEKNYHVDTETPAECFAVIRGKSLATGEYFEDEIQMLPDLIREPFVVGEIIPNDLTKQMLRLRAQQLMFDVLNKNKEGQVGEYDSQMSPMLMRQNAGPLPTLRRQNAHNGTTLFPMDTAFGFSQDDNQTPRSSVSTANTEVPGYENEGESVAPVRDIKKELQDFQKAILSYMSGSLEDDEFLKNVCDDINIALMTMRSRNQYMYVSARQSSQGRQQTYNVSDIEIDLSLVGSLAPIPMMSRTNTNSVNATPSVMRTMTQMTQGDEVVSP